MGYSLKHGNVTTERGAIPADEPVIVFRAADVLSADVLSAYLKLALRHPGMDGDHITAVTHARNVFERWQAEHPDRVKTPDTDLAQFDLSLPADRQARFVSSCQTGKIRTRAPRKACNDRDPGAAGAVSGTAPAGPSARTASTG